MFTSWVCLICMFTDFELVVLFIVLLGSLHVCVCCCLLSCLFDSCFVFADLLVVLIVAFLHFLLIGFTIRCFVFRLYMVLGLLVGCVSFVWVECCCWLCSVLLYLY